MGRVDGLGREEYDVVLMSSNLQGRGGWTRYSLGRLDLREAQSGHELPIEVPVMGVVQGQWEATGARIPAGRSLVGVWQGDYREMQACGNVDQGGKFSLNVMPGNYCVGVWDAETGVVWACKKDVDVQAGGLVQLKIGADLCEVKIEMVPDVVGKRIVASRMDIGVHGKQGEWPSTNAGVVLSDGSDSSLLILPRIRIDLTVRSNAGQVMGESTFGIDAPLAEFSWNSESQPETKVVLRLRGAY